MHSVMWANMFHLAVPILEKILRPILVYVFLVVVLRLAGKRELAQLNPFDLVVLLTLSNTVQNAIIGDDNSLTGGLIGAATLLMVNYIFVRFLYSHPEVDAIVEGRSDMLMDHGKLDRSKLRKDLITLPELEAAAHKQGFDSLADVDCARIEPGGTISFTAKKPSKDDVRHKELLERFEKLSQELSQLRLNQQGSTS
jgi:uncharacterized membrane protein YcaP (DUF421 family)